ncbi:TIGR02302 family protein [Hyphomicrobium methylovorum]|uniref:TIGR02302 family protein n=1 Tax=Hyphomicrobium methylovorum TaxID=84 RepID=UPI001FE4AB2C|nr:TIGR02302 family protein [Hyphomicrobium methylovorum]
MSRSFARKVRLSGLALAFERLWPRLWLLIGLAALFVFVSFTGVWPHLGDIAHKIALAAFAAAAIAALIYAVRIPWPTREEAVRRIEQRSGVPHRPATSYEDTLSSGTTNAATSALWQAHRERLAKMIARLRIGPPRPRTDRFDPVALRSLAILLLIPAALLATGSLSDRLASAFRFGVPGLGPATRVDAWITPPPYTALPPVMLSDGATGGAQAADDDKKRFFTVPDRSLLTLRGVGFGSSGVSIEVLSDGSAEPTRIEAQKPKAGDTSNVSEARFEVRKSARVRALSGSHELGQWTFDVIPDELPKITLTKDITATPRGSMRVAFKAEDDYGVSNAAVKVRQIAPKEGDPRTAWARPAPLTGPRLPLERPPVLSLKLSRPGAKTVEGSDLLEVGEHPWAGQRVELWLEATDVAGQVGRSAAIEMVLPARRFKNPLARALIEQRGKLAVDSRNRPMVARALDALTMEPEGFINDTTVYLGLRSVFHRIERQGSREAIASSVAELWQIALRVEDGNLSQAERNLKDAQDRLSDALQKGADDKEIQDALADLKKKLNDYLSEMQKNAEKDNPSDPNQQQQNEDMQQLGQNDLDQMMKDLEKNARNGSREEAERMLSELRELMDRLQAGNTPEAREQQQRAQEMMKKLNQLSDLTGKQQQLMDDTFGKQRQQDGQRGGSQDDPNGDGEQQGGMEPGQQGNEGQGQQGQQGQGQQGQQGQDRQGQGQQGQGGRSGSQQRGKGSLQDRQAQLKNELEKLKKDLEQMGVGDPEKLGNAQDAMGKAEEALRQGDLDEASNQQAQALDQMRQSAQQMAEQMQQNAQQRLGRGGNSPRDPLGRPQRAQGPDQGTSVKVPDAIDAQRAREILEELRRRSGESLRPQDELDYIDRLLKRF